MSIKRIEALEQDMAQVKNTLQEMAAIAGLGEQFEAFKGSIDTRLESIENFVGGYNTVAGLAKKHWKTILVFGAGVMSSAGIGNPKVWEFINTFAGG